MKFGMKKNEKAVSPVIGVILMVVITVIIAAVLAVFAFGIGAPGTTPSAALKIQTISVTGGIDIVHSGGDPVVLANTQVLIDPDTSPTETGDEAAGTLDAPTAELGSATFFDPGEVSHVTTTVTLVAGQVARVRVIDTESGNSIMNAVATTMP